MREVFEPVKPLTYGDSVFYTIRHQDIGKTVIATTAGNIHVESVMGRVMGSDVGKRVYFTPVTGIWSLESESQRDRRRTAERDRP